MLIGGLAGIAAFEACSGVLMGAVLGAEQYDGQYFVYSADSGGIFGAWFAGRPINASTLMAVGYLLPAGWLADVDPRRFGVMNVDAACSRRALFFRCRDAVAGDQRRDGAVPLPWRARLARWSVVCQNIWFRRAGVAISDVAANRSGQPGVVDDLNGIVDRAVLATAGDADVASGAARLSAHHRSIVISSMGERCYFIRSRITRICGAE